MKIGILVNDDVYHGMDFSKPLYGNPGVSGTIYEFILLTFYLSQTHQTIVFHYGNNIYPTVTMVKKIENKEDITNERNLIDILIFQNGYDEEWYRFLEENKIASIIWAHNYLTGTEAETINRYSYIKRVVFVGREQYDRYIANDVIKKSTYIYNMFVTEQEGYIRSKELPPNVTYTGSLVPAKGFHMLAKVWKDILREVPNAQLYVLGSGKLYGHDRKLGSYDIADAEYEKVFIPYLINERGEILPSVHFCGVLGREKEEIYRKTKVGVMNPTGISETFGLSAVEMEACGIPVVTAKRYGLLDTVCQNKTGMLIKNEKQLADAVVRLLLDDGLNGQMGSNALQYVKKFSPEHIVPQWVKMFQDIEDGEMAQFIKPNSNFLNDHKYIWIINRWLRTLIPAFPSIIGFRSKLKT